MVIISLAFQNRLRIDDFGLTKSIRHILHILVRSITRKVMILARTSKSRKAHVSFRNHYF